MLGTAFYLSKEIENLGFFGTFKGITIISQRRCLRVYEFELIQKARAGNFIALQEWMDIHSKKVEHFAFQYGLTLEMAYEVTLDTFVSFRNELKNHG